MKFEEFGTLAGCRAAVELSLQLLANIEAASYRALGGVNREDLRRLREVIRGYELPGGGFRGGRRVEVGLFRACLSLS